MVEYLHLSSTQSVCVCVCMDFIAMQNYVHPNSNCDTCDQFSNHFVRHKKCSRLTAKTKPCDAIR